jgi:recombination protein RecR
VSDQDICHICGDTSRDHSTVCVVENIRDVMAIEQTGQFNGVYHVLGGIISPVDGIGPENLTIDNLVSRCREEETREIIMGISPTMEGDTTIFYISRQLEGQDVKITSIARGISFGGDLEYTDEQTLARSIATRMPYESYLHNNGQ